MKSQILLAQRSCECALAMPVQWRLPGHVQTAMSSDRAERSRWQLPWWPPAAVVADVSVRLTHAADFGERYDARPIISAVRLPLFAGLGDRDLSTDEPPGAGRPHRSW